MINTEHSQRIKKPIKNVNRVSILLFLFFYYSIGTLLELPGGELLRWSGAILIAIIGTFEHYQQETPFKLFPYQYCFLIIPTIFVFFQDQNIMKFGIMRSASFFFIIYSLFSYYNREKVNKKYIETHFNLFSLFLISVMIIQGVLFFVNLNEFGSFKGIYNNKNYFASIATVALICSLVPIIKEGKHKNISKGAFVLIAILLIATGSRSALIGLFLVIFSIPFILFEQKKNVGKIKTILLMVLIIGFIMFFISYVEIPALDRLLMSESKDGSTGLSRSGWWDKAIPIFQMKPLFGWGNSAVYYHITQLNQGTIWGFHNSYLVILVENGIIGSFFYVIFFVVTIIKVVTRYKKSNLSTHEKKLVKLMMLICIFLLINAFAEAFLFAVGNPMSISFWLTLIMLEKYLSLKS